MEFKNVKRILFLKKLTIIIVLYFFVRAFLQLTFLGQTAIDNIANYLIIMSQYLLISQIYKAESYLSLNKLLLMEKILYFGLFILIFFELKLHISF